MGLDKKTVKALGAMPLSHFAMVVRLRAVGIHTAVYSYDWRQDIQLLGEELEKFLSNREQKRSR